MTRTDPIRVCVTGVGGGGLGEQLLKALRLAETPYRVLATDITTCSAGLVMGDVSAIVPPASAPEYVDTLLDLCRKHGIQVLLPGSEPELRVLSEQRAAFQDQGIFLPLNDPDTVKCCMDKHHLFETLTGLGIEVPWFRRFARVEDALDLPSFPAVFKPSVGSGGSANTYIVQNPDEAKWIANYLSGFNMEFLAQEYVGHPSAEYTVGVLSDMDGNILNSIAVRRFTLSALGCRFRVANRTGRKELGDTLVISSGISQGDIGPCPEVAGPCEAIAKALGSRGPCNIQLRFVDNKVYVFEINPRFSGTTSLRALAGFNEPDILIRKHVLGETIQPRFAYRTGVILRKLEEYLLEN